MQRSRIRSDVGSWLSDPTRIQDLVSKFPASESVMTAVHLAGPNGISSGSFPEASEDVLSLLASEFVIVLDSRDPPSWCPLTDLTPTVFAAWASSLPERQRPLGRKPAARSFLEGVAALSAAIDSGKARLNRDGSLNRRDRPSLRDSFSYMATFGEAATERALDLALDLLCDLQFLFQRDGRLEMSHSIDTWLSEADTDPWIAIHWWERRHPAWSGMRDLLASRSELGLPGSAVAELFLRREGDMSVAASSPTWTDLPDSLRQALVLGLLESDSEGTTLTHTWPCGEHAASGSERAWWCTSDFQLFLAPDAPLHLHRAAGFMGVREVSELVTRYHITREAILDGAAFPRWGEQLPRLIEHLAPPRSVGFQLEEWLASRRACLFDSVRVLRVPDPRRHQELASLEAFRSLVLEVIPGWGFAIAQENETLLRRLLGTLGYDPPTDPPPAAAESWRPATAPPPQSEEDTEPAWQWPQIGISTRKAPTGSGSRYATGAPKELDFPDIVRLVEYAVLTECEIDVVLKGQTQRILRLTPQRFDRRKEPVSLEGRMSSSGERRDIPIDTIRKIALAEI